MHYSSYLLLHNGITGGIFILLLFCFCFACVHLAKYAKIGWQSQHQPKKTETPSKEEPKKNEPAASGEPIYYIVERKKTRAKHHYSEPKEIRFK